MPRSKRPKQRSPQSALDIELAFRQRADAQRRMRRKTAKILGFRSRNTGRNHETYTKHFGSCAERLPAVDGTPFGDFPAEKAS
jgi:hypothetical protein